jgi:hypothetical protein
MGSYAKTIRGTSHVLNSFSKRVRGTYYITLQPWNKTLRGTYHILVNYGNTINGRYRIANDALARFELYKGEDAQPDFSAAPWETYTSHPHVTAVVGNDKTVYLVLRRRNEHNLQSKNRNAFGRGGATIKIDNAGDEVIVPPTGPDYILLSPAAGGKVQVDAIYYYEEDASNVRADEFAVWITSDGSDPDPDNDPADDTATMIRKNGVARLSWLSGAYADGLTIKISVRTRRSGSPDVDSENTGYETTTSDTDGPATPDLEAFLGEDFAQRQ